MYVPGGVTGLPRVDTKQRSHLATLQCYDLVAGRWDPCCTPMMGGGRASHGAAALHGEVWAVGGSSGTRATLASVEVYSPQLNSWRPGRPLPQAASYCTCAVLQCS